jgi:hypothetical protein
MQTGSEAGLSVAEIDFSSGGFRRKHINRPISDSKRRGERISFTGVDLLQKLVSPAKSLLLFRGWRRFPFSGQPSQNLYGNKDQPMKSPRESVLAGYIINSLPCLPSFQRVLFRQKLSGKTQICVFTKFELFASRSVELFSSKGPHSNGSHTPCELFPGTNRCVSVVDLLPLLTLPT